MTSARYLGVSFLKGRIQLAEVEHAKTVQLTTLAERETALDFAQAGIHLTPEHPQLNTFVKELGETIKQNKISTTHISFALPTEPVFINIIPVDSSLKGPDLSQYVQWEVDQYFPNVPPRDFLTTSQPLPEKADHIKELFVVCVRRGMVGFLQKAAAQLKLKLHLVDVDHFSTEKTLLQNYPEVSDHPVALLGLRYGGVDASLVLNGSMIDYRAFLASSSEEAKKSIHQYLKYLKERNSVKAPSAMFLHGNEIAPEMPKTLHKETGVQCVALNAVRKLTASNKLYKPFVQESYRFAAAIGLALRRA
ncbi:MAG: pilus assembly protein PilM [Ignavibacteriales bacterium]|nr:pilus assembly protein PilM [Ignavibacteriales bacterium]